MTEAFRATKRHKRLVGDIKALRGLETVGAFLARTGIQLSERQYRRIENAEFLPRTARFTDIIDGLQVPRRQRDALARRASAVTTPLWFEKYPPEVIGPSLRDFLADEDEADAVWSFSLHTLDGLAQTPAYGFHIIAAAVPSLSPEIREKRLLARIRRQERVTGDNPLNLHFVFTEAAVRLEVGGPDVMREQRLYLAYLARLPHVTIRIVPDRAGAYPAIGTPPFYLLSRNSERPEVAYVEPGIYVDDASDVSHYTAVYNALRDTALSEAESYDLILYYAHR